MPLLTPAQIHSVLRTEKASLRENQSVEDLLDEASLSKEELLLNLSSIMRSGETDAVRLRALEGALRLHGLLSSTKESSTEPAVAVQIIIQDGDFSGLNPILIPR